MQYQIKVNMEELYRKIVLGLFLSLVFVGCKQTTDMLEVNFKTPPEQIQTSVYWYWIAGNISALIPQHYNLTLFISS